MAQPETIPAIEVTAAYRGEAASLRVQPNRVEKALVTQPDSQAISELQTLLHKRLRFLSALCACFVGMFGLLRVVRVIAGLEDSQQLTVVGVSFWAVFLLVGVSAGLLWIKRNLPLGQLRLIELVLCGSQFLNCFVDFGYTIWFTDRWLTPPLPDHNEIAFVGLWFCFACWFWIVNYGVLIPNSSRRCATVVIGAALIPVCLWTAFGLTCAAVWDHCGGQFLTWLVVISTTVGVAVALAIYSCHRVESLQREVATARRLGQYLLGKLLGSGGMGEVYLAEHTLLQRLCAVKLIRAERVGDLNCLRRFEREVKITATLTHPNTVQVYDYGHAADGTFYYVMEYLPGLTLEEIVKRAGPLPPARAIHLLRQVCGALREAHGIGLIHRDIKPGNVMVCERGGLHDTVKLLDFGLVLPNTTNADERLTQDGAIAGTPAYMSPEQAGGQDDVDARSDIYSVGALAYFLLTAQPPFANRSQVKMLAAHLYEAPEPLTRHRPDLPADLEAVILRCLAKRPEERFENAESLDEALAHCSVAGQWSSKEAACWWRSQSAT